MVGAGIAGLTTAFHLQKRGVDALVLEAENRVGGKLRTAEIRGLRVEDGADAFLPRDPVPVELCHELGLEDLVPPAVFGAYIWLEGALRKLPTGSPYGIPRSPVQAWRAGFLSGRGAVRAGAEALRLRPLRGPDVSIGTFVRDRFGTEVLANMVDPLLAGIRGGTSEGISLAAGAREIDVLARTRPSILRALARDAQPTETERQGNQAPGFLAPRGGMQELTDALAERVEVRRGARVRRIVRDTNRFVLAGDDGEITADGVVLAIPSHAAAPLVEHVDDAVARALQRIRFTSATVVALVYASGGFTPPPDGSGFLVPSRDGLAISGCTWYSAKWPHAATGTDEIVLRCVLGRGSGIDDDDDNVLARVAHDLELVCGITSAPTAHRITRWKRAVPILEPGHLELIATIEASLAREGPLMVTGAGYRGAGIPDCISGGIRTAAAMAERLREST